LRLRDEPKLFAGMNARKPVVRQGRSNAPAPSNAAEPRLAILFRARHGTNFDPASEIDRQKMEEMLLASGSRSARLF
jgi:hypothetical protein